MMHTGASDNFPKAKIRNDLGLRDCTRRQCDVNGRRCKRKYVLDIVLVFGLRFLLILCMGCIPSTSEIEPFGEVRKPISQSSINGLGIHQRMWESAGARVSISRSLTPRLGDADTIVLVGQSYAPLGIEARYWLEEWLGEKAGRTVVYFGRDFNAALERHRETIAQQTLADQADARVEMARLELAEQQARLRVIPESTFCGWFFMSTDRPLAKHTEFDGPLAAELETKKASWRTGIVLLPPSPDLIENEPSWIRNPSSAVAPNFLPFDYDEEEDDYFQSTWSPSEYSTPDDWEAAFEELPKVTELMNAADGTPLIFQLSDEVYYPGSQILIVVNGAPFLNGGMVYPFFQKVSASLIERCQPSSKVVLIPFEESGIAVSNYQEPDPKISGLEMLLIWPLNAVMIPAVILGVIVILRLMPILGRPQSMPLDRSSDFGSHIEAIAQILRDTGDEEYANKMVHQYTSRVRGETFSTATKKVNAPPSI
ncbi:MAG: hypothetical protein KDB03_25700 [Planctomycetales bacterium]|nr:hypothetical protein [Planctomycetales bacterium]